MGTEDHRGQLLAQVRHTATSGSCFAGRAVVACSLVAIVLLAVPFRGQAGSLPEVHPVHAASPGDAVRIVLRPFVTPNYNFLNCTMRSPRANPSLACPETDALRHWLRVRRLPAGARALPFCRCQSPPRTVRVLQIHSKGPTAAWVDVQWDFGSPHGSHIYARDTFVVVRQGNDWLINDEYCTGHPQTSIYRGVAGARPCYKV